MAIDKKLQRRLICVFCCPFWYSYYAFLHDTVRACDICWDVFNSINSTFCKVLYIVIMYFFGFSIMSCVLCIFGLVHCFKTPYKNFESAGNLYEAFYAMVYEKDCQEAGKCKELLSGFFAGK